MINAYTSLLIETEHNYVLYNYKYTRYGAIISFLYNRFDFFVAECRRRRPSFGKYLNIIIHLKRYEVGVLM